jgi:peptide-methionine (S)-S-oxide reductase
MTNSPREVATLAGGCFWCLEAVFEQLDGVDAVDSGYSGGTVANPSYREVCGGRTGHAEVVQISFDPERISYRELLEFFFAFHDPTTLNRQGADVGTQYRSAIFTHSDAQAATAREVIEQLTRDGAFDSPIVTVVEPFKTFYRAEDYHQGYFRQNGDQPYCRVVIAPKMQKLREKYRAKLKRAVETG